MNTPSRQPKRTAKQFALQWTAFTISVFLMLSAIKLLPSLGLILMIVTVALSSSEQRAAQLIPVLLVMFACLMVATFCDVMSPAQGVPIALKYRIWYVLALIGLWSVGIILDYRKWRASRSGKQP